MGVPFRRPRSPRGVETPNVHAAQRALAHRARMNGLARTGAYSVDLESSAA